METPYFPIIHGQFKSGFLFRPPNATRAMPKASRDRQGLESRTLQSSWHLQCHPAKDRGTFQCALLGMIENLANQEQRELCSKDLKDNFKETLYIIYLCVSRVIWGRKKPPS